MNYKDLVEKALKAKENAYAPYSKFKVGAALLSNKEEVFTGCNVENASFGLTNCAERTAIFKAVSDGKKDFKAIALASDSDKIITPCGACRQVLLEFGPHIDVVMANNKGEYKVNKVMDLIPNGFDTEYLEEENKK
ncbi:cytidine deaminase [Desulfonispora thiosulfatigenes DSM 11270]|uniref:Cytidine deaminase n=1 Tax=Desulfonispora thiosulfatigenes DSM 11270 TaxID=656914 RepID=A0A1W1VCT4_DESTI|nr:cytidine deaminase [Desulfonispora thiosulfatigenes]SMB91000.1 cytidine deaminase [Desulfonispora thiosulfatigenes DSM 11270]